MPAKPSIISPSDIRNQFLIVGLGNVGARYADTRHNIGFSVADSLAEKLGMQFIPGKGDYYESVTCATASAGSWWKRLLGLSDKVSSTDGPVHIIKPTTLMNRSGRAVRQACERLGFSPQQVIVVVDDFHLPLGTIRLRKNGSDGGHNGLLSIIQELDTDDYPRLRVGIGPKPANSEIIPFVLGHFAKDEELQKVRAVQLATDSLLLALMADSENPLDLAASKYNIPPSNPAPGSGGDGGR